MYTRYKYRRVRTCVYTKYKYRHVRTCCSTLITGQALYCNETVSNSSLIMQEKVKMRLIMGRLLFLTSMIAAELGISNAEYRPWCCIISQPYNLLNVPRILLLYKRLKKEFTFFYFRMYIFFIKEKH